MRGATRVLRIEDECGNGMYWSDRSKGIIPIAESSRHPSPESDTLLSKELYQRRAAGRFFFSSYIFGFLNEAQLRNWLYDDDWLVNLSKAWLTLSEYYADDVLVGHTQVMFKRTEQTAVVKHNICEFFNIKKSLCCK